MTFWDFATAHPGVGLMYIIVIGVVAYVLIEAAAQFFVSRRDDVP